MATHPIAIARLLNDVRNSFITAINFDMEIRDGYKYDENAQKIIGENITAINQGLENLINAVIAIVPPKEPEAPATEAPAEAVAPAEQPVEQSAPVEEAPAEKQEEPVAESAPVDQ